MKISDARNSALYQAIAEPITKARIKILRHEVVLTHFNVDDLLFDLTKEIYDEVKQAMNIES